MSCGDDCFDSNIIGGFEGSTTQKNMRIFQAGNTFGITTFQWGFRISQYPYVNYYIWERK